MDLAFHLPNSIPSIIRTLGIHDEIVQRPSGRGAEADGVDAVVVRTEPNAEFVRIFYPVSHTQLLKNGIWYRVVHHGSDVEVLVIKSNPHLSFVRWGTLGKRSVLCKILGAWLCLPNGFHEQTYHWRLINTKGQKRLLVRLNVCCDQAQTIGPATNATINPAREIKRRRGFNGKCAVCSTKIGKPLHCANVHGKWRRIRGCPRPRVWHTCRGRSARPDKERSANNAGLCDRWRQPRVFVGVVRRVHFLVYIQNTPNRRVAQGENQRRVSLQRHALPQAIQVQSGHLRSFFQCCCFCLNNRCENCCLSG